MSDELRERVARLLCAINDFDPADPVDVRYFYQSADDTIALVLEEAAKVARGNKANLEECGEYDTGYDDGRDDAAAAIRALNDKA